MFRNKKTVDLSEGDAPAAKGSLAAALKRGKPRQDETEGLAEKASSSKFRGLFKGVNRQPAGDAVDVDGAVEASELAAAGQQEGGDTPPVQARRGIFSRKPAAAAVDTSSSAESPVRASADAPAPASATKKSLFGLGRKKASVPAAAPAEDSVPASPPPKPAKKRPSKPATRLGGKAKELIISAELENGRLAKWRLTANGLVQLADSEGVAGYYSFAREDFRFRADKPLSWRRASDLCVSEIGEEVVLLNRSKDLGAVYAAKKLRVLEEKAVIYPGQQVLDALYKERQDETAADMVFGFQFTDADSGDSLVVLYHYGVVQETGKPQITVNPDNMDFVLSQFLVSRKLSRRETPVVLLTNADFLGKAHVAQSFAQQAMLGGVSLTGILWAVTVVLGGAAAVVGSMNATHMYNAQADSRQTDKLKVEVQNLGRERSELVTANAGQFPRVTSLLLEPMVAKARAAWLPQSMVALKADEKQLELSVTIHYKPQIPGFSSPTTALLLGAEEADKVLKAIVLEGCEKSPLFSDAKSNEIKITYICQSSVPLSGYLGG